MGRLKHLVLPGLLGLAVYFAVFGGEYSVLEVRSTREALARERARVEELRRTIDSLGARADSLEEDRALLERLAREKFGMIGPDETLYRTVLEDLVEGDSAGTR